MIVPNRERHSLKAKNGDKIPTGLLDTIHLMDWKDLVSQLPDESVDVVFTDMPYGVLEVGAKSDIENLQHGQVVWDVKPNLTHLMGELLRVVRGDGAIVLTANPRLACDLMTTSPKEFRYKWYWEKQFFANVAQVNFRPGAIVEEVLVFSKSPAVYTKNPMRYFPQKRELLRPVRRTSKLNGNSDGRPMRNASEYERDVKYTHETVMSLQYFKRETHTTHPTEKPTAMVKYFLQTYALTDEIVLDPFMGSGTTAVAARELGMHFLGTDINPAFVVMANKRLDEPYTQRML